jgi:peptidoglycan DL-endopeptidase CwlO
MSLEDVLGRIQQLQQLVAPPEPVITPADTTTATGQDFGSTLASVSAGVGGLPTTVAAATTAAYGTSLSTPSYAASAMSTAVATPQSSGTDVVADSIQYLGVPYKWGGTNPATGLDCSGLVQKVFADKGVALPRTAAEQATVGTEVQGGLANAQPGDLVFFGSPVHHVGIYAGNNMMVEAPHTGTKVQVHSIDAAPTHVRRIALPAPVAAAATTTLTPNVTTVSTVGTVGTVGSVGSVGSIGSMAMSGSATTTLAALSAADPTTAMDNLGVPAALRPVLTAAAQSQGLPVSLLAAVAKVESGYDTSSVSSAGAQGLMQLMPDTAAGLGANPWDPASAANGAAKLIRGYINQYGSVPLALAAYNAGPGAVAKYGGIPPYAETQAYVQRVGALAAAA